MNQDLPPSLSSPKTSGMAITSLVLGICTFFTCCLTGLPAVIFGILGIRQIGKNPGMGGKGLAIAGLVLGGISLLFTPVVISIGIPAFHGAMEASKQMTEVLEAQQVGTMLTEYAKAHDGKYPDSLSVLLEDKTQSSVRLEKLLYEEGTTEFKWNLTPGLTTESPGETILLESKKIRGSGVRAGHIVYTVEGGAKIEHNE